MINCSYKKYTDKNSARYFLPNNSAYYLEQQKKSQEVEKKKKNNFFKTKKGMATLAALCGVILFLRRPGNSLGQRLSKFVNRMDDKLAQSKANGKNDFFASLCTKPIVWAKKAGECCLWATNFIPARDLFCEKVMNYIKIGKFNIGKKICDGIRIAFEKMTIAAHKSVFNKKTASISRNLHDLSSIFEESGKFTTEEIKQIQKELFGDKIMGAYQRQFGYASFNIRLGEYIKKIKDLPQEAVKRLKNFRNEKGYITDNLTSEARSDYRSQLQKARRGISCNRKDVSLGITTCSDEIRHLLNADDVATRELLQKLNGDELKTLLKDKSGKEQFKEILKQLENSFKRYGEQDKSKEEVLSKHLQEIRDIINEGKSAGALQEFLKKHKGKLSTKEFKKAKKIAESIGAQIDKNIDSEMRVYQKYGEMKLGSAFTDIGVLLCTAGLGSWLIAKSETKDEFFEAGLRQGFPILGTVGTLAYCTARMMPNLPSLAISLLVGAGVKKAGDFTANQYTKWNEKYKDTKEILAQYKLEHSDAFSNSKTTAQS